MTCADTFVAMDLRQRILRLQITTIAWMTVEAGVSLLAAWRSHSPALVAFGGDSFVELLSAGVVLWRFRTGIASAKAEQLAARINGVLLFALAAYVVAISVLAMRVSHEANPSILGVMILLAAALIMPILARRKRQLSAATGSAALRADATQSAVCGYLSWIAMAGLLLNVIWHIGWVDPVAALCMLPLILWEGWEALQGKTCECH